MFKKGTTIGESTRFSTKNQPENRGRKGKSVTDWLKEYGDAKEIELEVTTIDPDGKKKTIKRKVESKTSISQLIAITIINKAVEGDNKAIDTFLDRTEGKPQQHLDFTSNDMSIVWQEEKSYEN